jgi:hypothetical protein
MEAEFRVNTEKLRVRKASNGMEAYEAVVYREDHWTRMPEMRQTK